MLTGLLLQLVSGATDQVIGALPAVQIILVKVIQKTSQAVQGPNQVPCKPGGHHRLQAVEILLVGCGAADQQVVAAYTPWIGVPGLLLDRTFGLLSHAPIYALAWFAIGFILTLVARGRAPASQVLPDLRAREAPSSM